jgi:DNA-binding transcriptional LysR family regulator
VSPGGGIGGRVVVAAQPAFGLTCLAPIVPALLERYPRLHLELRLLDRGVDFVADGVDVAVLAGERPINSASLVARRIGSYAIVVCAAPRLLAACDPIRSVADLARVPCVVQDTGSSLWGSSLWSFETERGPESVVPRGRAHTNELLTTHRLVLAGAGVAWLPTWLADDDLRNGRLARVLSDVTPPMIDVFAVFDKRARGAKAVGLVVDEVTKALGGLGPSRSAAPAAGGRSRRA